jgi:hypothetical protein
VTTRSRQGQAWRPDLVRSPKLGSGAGPVGHGRSHQRGGSPPRSPRPMSRPPRKPTTHSARRTVVPSTGIPCPSQRTDAPPQRLRLTARPARCNPAYNSAGGQVPHHPHRGAGAGICGVSASSAVHDSSRLFVDTAVRGRDATDMTARMAVLGALLLLAGCNGGGTPPTTGTTTSAPCAHAASPYLVHGAVPAAC